VHRFFTPLLRWVYFGFGILTLCYCSLSGYESSSWHKERLYRKVVTGDQQSQLDAVAELVWLRGHEQLVRALRARSPDTRFMVARSLREIWQHEAGEDAYGRSQAAAEAVRQNNSAEALRLLTELVRDYPSFAEGWNHRATLLWRMGHYQEAIEDCKRVLGLNPNHFGAWHGMGLCQLRMGDVMGAYQSFRTAVRIHPYESGFRQSLRQCEEILNHLNPRPSSPAAEV
jgi:tetratricopeptide (TPR) repeat protein